MAAMHTSSIYESELLRGVTGSTIRPGGLDLTGRAVDFCRFPPGARLADVGCGVGATVEYLRQNRQLDAIGMEISSRLLKEGRRRDETLPLVQAGAEQLPCGDESLDGVLCECVLSLLPEPGRALREFHRILRPGGHLILSDMYLRSPGGADIFKEQSADGCLQGALPRHRMVTMIHEAGFTILRWEDHSAFLKELAARLILAHGSMEEFWDKTKSTGCPGGMQQLLTDARPGYYLLIARKA